MISFAAALAATVGVVGTALAGGERAPGGWATLDRKAAREPAPRATRRVRNVEIAWTGDIALSTKHGLPADGGRTLLTQVTPALKAADLTIGNLEGTLGTTGAPKCTTGAKNCHSFQAPPSYASLFAGAGFDVMNVANNHHNDYGTTGQAQTLAALAAADLKHTGRPGQITVVRKRGIKIALIGFAPYPWAARITDLAAARTLVTAARRQADVVVVLMHAGAEGSDKIHTPVGREFAYGEDRGDTRGFAHTVVDAGADLVLGSGPHVVRGIERYRGRVIAYSLGDFLGYRTFGLGGNLSLSAVLRIRIDARGRFHGGRWTSLRLQPPGVPVPDPSGTSAALMASVSEQDFGTSAVTVEPDGLLR